VAGGTGRKACNLCYQNASPSTMSPVFLPSPLFVFSVLMRSTAQLIELHLDFKVIDVNTFQLIMYVSCVRALDECPPLAERKLNPYTFVISCLIKLIKIPVTLCDTISSQCNRSKIASSQTEISLRWQCPQTSQSLFTEHLMQIAHKILNFNLIV